MSATTARLTRRIAPAALLAVAAVAHPLAGQTRTAEPFRWEGRLQPGQTLEIKGVNGPIRAVAASGNVARVDAARSARRSDPTEVQIVVVEHSGGVTLCAVYPSSVLRRNECRPGTEGSLGANNNDVQVAFTVEVPAGLALTARTTNGAVNVDGVTGATEAHSTNGNININGGSTAIARTTNGSVSIATSGFADARTTNGSITATLGQTAQRELSFRTTNGGITIRLPANTHAAVEARTSNGAIRSDLPLTIGTSSRNRLSGTLGNGGPLIDLRTTNGTIRIERS